MSAIFRSRKIPRHLVIEPEAPMLSRRKRRLLPLLLVCCLVLLLLAVATQRF